MPGRNTTSITLTITMAAKPEVKKGKKVKKAKISAKKSDKSNLKRKIVGPVALIILASIALLGFFWQDLGFAVPRLAGFI